MTSEERKAVAIRESIFDTAWHWHYGGLCPAP